MLTFNHCKNHSSQGKSVSFQEIHEIEDEIEGTLKRAHPPQPLYIRNTGANVCVQLKDVPEDWTVNGPSEEVTPNVKFLFQ